MTNTSITYAGSHLFTDSHTGRTIVSQLFGTTSLLRLYDNDVRTYSVSQGGGHRPPESIIKPSAADRFAFVPPISCLVTPVPCAQLAVRGPLTQYPNAVYYASQDIGDAEMALARTVA